MRLAVVDAYSAEGRVRLAAAGCTPAGELYKRVLLECSDDLDITVLIASAASRVLPEAVAAGDYDGVVWTGSDLNAPKPNDEVRAQIDLCRALLDQGVFNFGSCWALQLATVACGGEVASSPKGREFGIARGIESLSDHALLSGRQEPFSSFASHEDEVVRLPDNGRRLARNDWSEVQALEVRRGPGLFWAVQYHPEYDFREVARLAAVRGPQLVEHGLFESVDAVREYYEPLEALDDGGDAPADLGAGLIQPVERRNEILNWLDAMRES